MNKKVGIMKLPHAWKFLNAIRYFFSLEKLDGFGSIKLENSAIKTYIATHKLLCSAEFTIALGEELIEVKDNCSHGEFILKLESLFIQHRNAQRCMKIAKVVHSLSSFEKQKLCHLNKTSLIKLCSCEVPVIRQLIATGEIERIPTMSTKEVSSYLDQLTLKTNTSISEPNTVSASQSNSQH